MGPKEVCRVVPRQQCDTVPAQKCLKVPSQQCRSVPRQECEDVPKQECGEVCENIFWCKVQIQWNAEHFYQYFSSNIFRNALTDETGYSKPLRQIGSPDHLSFLLLHFPYLKYVCQFLTILNSTMKYNNIYFIYSSFKHYIF